MPSWTKADKAERDRCIDELRNLLKPGDTVHCILRSVSRSGMFRRISPVIISPDGTTLHPDYLVSVACEIQKPGKAVRGGDGIPISGCGMDMGFHLVSNLSAVLYPEGFGCIGDRCPSNDHSNGDRDHTPHSTYLHDKAQHEKLGKAPTIEPHWHRSGDYALRHRWI